MAMLEQILVGRISKAAIMVFSLQAPGYQNLPSDPARNFPAPPNFMRRSRVAP